MFPFGRLTQNSPRYTHPFQHQTESVMSVVEGVDTALSTNMLISYATEMLHPSALLEMGHSTAAADSDDRQMREHTNTHACTLKHNLSLYTCMCK